VDSAVNCGIRKFLTEYRSPLAIMSVMIKVVSWIANAMRSKQSKLLDAAQEGDFQEVRRLIRKGVNIHQRDKSVC
jgi:DnaJ-domain-containing protein 1